MTISRTPTYNLKVVLRETGLSADTLRAWERRYGLPRPERSPGGHRLYSQYDIETLKWLIARQGEGLSISRAVDLWHKQAAQGLDPLAASPSQAAPAPLESPALMTADLSLQTMQRQWISACMAFNESAAEQVLNQAFAIYPLETVCLELLQAGLAEIGQRWFDGQASVQHEHFASNLVTRRLDALIAAAPPPTRPYTVLVGCPPGEWHTLSLLLTTLFLRRRGWNVVYLGANVPTERFEETLSVVRPRLVVLAAQQLHTAVSLRHTAHYLYNKDATVGYGGRIFNLRPELRARIPAHFLGENLETATQSIEALILNPVLPPKAENHPPTTKLLSTFQQHKPSIEAHILRAAPELGLATEHLNTANHFMGINLLAALEFGDPSLLEAEIHWVGEYLGNIHRPQAEVNRYLSAYRHAVEAELGLQGQTITRWLENFVTQNTQKA